MFNEGNNAELRSIANPEFTFRANIKWMKAFNERPPTASPADIILMYNMTELDDIQLIMTELTNELKLNRYHMKKHAVLDHFKMEQTRLLGQTLFLKQQYESDIELMEK